MISKPVGILLCMRIPRFGVLSILRGIERRYITSYRRVERVLNTLQSTRGGSKSGILALSGEENIEMNRKSETHC